MVILWIWLGVSVLVAVGLMVADTNSGPKQNGW